MVQCPENIILCAVILCKEKITRHGTAICKDYRKCGIPAFIWSDISLSIIKPLYGIHQLIDAIRHSHAEHNINSCDDRLSETKSLSYKLFMTSNCRVLFDK